MIITDDCWLYAGRITSHHYGIVGDRYAHRVMWENTNGEIPKGLQIDHLCRVRRCINPKHLEPVTARENILRGKGVAAKNAKRTKCNYGHNFDAMNKGYRRCNTCNRLRAKKYSVKSKV